MSFGASGVGGVVAEGAVAFARASRKERDGGRGGRTNDREKETIRRDTRRGGVRRGGEENDE